MKCVTPCCENKTAKQRGVQPNHCKRCLDIMRGYYNVKTYKNEKGIHILKTKYIPYDVRVKYHNRIIKNTFEGVGK